MVLRMLRVTVMTTVIAKVMPVLVAAGIAVVAVIAISPALVPMVQIKMAMMGFRKTKKVTALVTGNLLMKMVKVLHLAAVVVVAVAIARTAMLVQLG
jgi:hypothetical protein